VGRGREKWGMNCEAIGERGGVQER
jgi:hypothetical protein